MAGTVSEGLTGGRPIVTRGALADPRHSAWLDAGRSVALSERHRVAVLENLYPQRIKGWWFLPGTPEVRAPGVLTWTPDGGAELELVGGLRRAQHELVGTDGQADASLLEADLGTIYGQTDAGKSVTLWDAERHNYRADIGVMKGRGRRDDFILESRE